MIRVGAAEELAGDVVIGKETSWAEEQKVRLLNFQSINRLQRKSQSYPRTAEQDESSGVMKNLIFIVSPEANSIGKSTALVIQVREVPSKSRSGRGGISYVGREFTVTNLASIKQ